MDAQIRNLIAQIQPVVSKRNASTRYIQHLYYEFDEIVQKIVAEPTK